MGRGKSLGRGRLKVYSTASMVTLVVSGQMINEQESMTHQLVIVEAPAKDKQVITKQNQAR
jgi:hypothetical protein